MFSDQYLDELLKWLNHGDLWNTSPSGRGQVQPGSFESIAREADRQAAKHGKELTRDELRRVLENDFKMRQSTPLPTDTELQRRQDDDLAASTAPTRIEQQTPVIPKPPRQPEPVAEPPSPKPVTAPPPTKQAKEPAQPTPAPKAPAAETVAWKKPPQQPTTVAFQRPKAAPTMLQTPPRGSRRAQATMIEPQERPKAAAPQFTSDDPPDAGDDWFADVQPRWADEHQNVVEIINDMKSQGKAVSPPEVLKRAKKDDPSIKAADVFRIVKGQNAVLPQVSAQPPTPVPPRHSQFVAPWLRRQGVQSATPAVVPPARMAGSPSMGNVPVMPKPPRPSMSNVPDAPMPKDWMKPDQQPDEPAKPDRQQPHWFHGIAKRLVQQTNPFAHSLIYGDQRGRAGRISGGMGDSSPGRDGLAQAMKELKDAIVALKESLGQQAKTGTAAGPQGGNQMQPGQVRSLDPRVRRFGMSPSAATAAAIATVGINSLGAFLEGMGT